MCETSDLGSVVRGCVCVAGNNESDFDLSSWDIPMPPEGFLVQPCPTGAYQAQPQAMQGIHMRPWSVQDSQAQLHTPQDYQGQPLSAQGYQAQPLPAQGGPAQLQGILTGKSKGSADLLNCALADLLEPETPEQFEAELFEDMFSLLPEGEE